MASVSGVSSSNSSSIYGNRNVLSGLATGMDTESLIENAVSGYKTKINNLLKQQTSLTWQQEAFRKVSDPMVQFARKYASYTSSTNLLSASFFNGAVKTVANGANADYVSASGKTYSDVRILGVKQLATKAAYTVSAADLDLGGSAAAATVTGQDPLKLDQIQKMSKVSGSLTLTYGSSRVIDLNFGDTEIYNTTEELVRGINAKLKATKVNNSDGQSVTADTMVSAKLENGSIVFSDNQNAGNSVTITGAAGKLKDTLKIDLDAKPSSIDVSALTNQDLVDDTTTVGDNLSGKTFSMTVDGKTKTITLPKYVPNATDPGQAAEDFVAGMNEAIQRAFGSSVKANLVDSKLQITGQKGSTISINTTDVIGGALGLGGSIATSYLDTGKSLGTVLGTQYKTDYDGNVIETMAGITGTALKGVGEISLNENTNTYHDTEGNLTDSLGNRLGKDGKQLYGYEFEMNGVSMTFTRDSAMESVLVGVNSSANIGFSAGFSKTTNNLQLTAKETGSMGELVIKENITDESGNTKGNLAAKLFGVVNDPGATTPVKGKYEAGKDAIVSIKVNNDVYDGVTRTDNSFNVDGLTVNLKDTFGDYTDKGNGTYELTDPDAAEKAAVTFTTSSDADKIVEVVKNMVEDLNKIIEATHSAFTDMPLTKSNKTRYEPLTEEDQEGMTETAIKNYEEKAKTGVLFGDRDLTSMYDKLLSAIAPSGSDGNILRTLGITTNYSQGVTTLEVDENALRTALDNNPDSVRDAFTKTEGMGGMMVNLNKVLDEYVSTTGSTKGILVEKAGSSYSALSMLHNTILDQIDALDVQIDSWQAKMSDKIDFYTQQFSRLEQLTQQMNSQSSLLMGMMGGGS